MIKVMMKRLAAVAVVAGVLAAAPALGADVDLSSPKATVTTLAKAMQEGDANAAKAAIYGDEQQMKAIDAMMRMLSSMQKMEKSARAKFGEEVVEETAGGLAEVVAQADKSEVEIDGDTAVVTVPQPVPEEGADAEVAGEAQRLQLKKVGDDWKIDAAALMQGEIPTDEQLKAVNHLVTAADSIATEIEEGKFESYDDARAAFQQRMFAAMMQSMPQEQQMPLPKTETVPAE